ncbi:MAG TPA: response regulator transcription factor [Dyella sp.]|uniref:response regulator transcription factor n=1 Tax=Dyella sp. TaxID=1869338 RepID=UPI002F94612B
MLAISPSSNETPSVDDATTMHVLVLEDDDLLRDRVLVPRLRQFGFDVAAIGQAADLPEQITVRRPDIVLLDVGLPDADGFEVTRRLRRETADIGIVMLTGRGRKTDRVRGLSEGADAYLAKPIDLDVLGATLFSLARRLRSTASLPEPMKQGWRLGADGWCLISPSGGTAALTKTEGRLMDKFLKNANRVISREELIGLFAADTYDFDPHRLDSLIHRLRKKVLTVLGEPLPLNAVHREGYVMVRV